MTDQTMDSSPSALPQLSSYLQPTPTGTVASPGTNIEIAISALTRHFESQLHKRKQSSPSVDTMTNAFPRPDDQFYQERRVTDGHLLSSLLSSQVGVAPSRETRSYFDGELSPTTPRRERTSRYLYEGDRKEIIARIDAGVTEYM
ncbi:hypothetical protein PHYSODRAFT_322981 [Phytophthora sojae]|uniref:Uncharacterized protein n=1 Tax=Phytophthora sojae (strain P6497) TaxID=1094619 RepID=G4YKX3_PHYSP|nr:hypothetical protein PHYSODRAFT_322981 [Phytophthora sojae]EGZ29464.1 hypothetical protein PHYSODRAFT_322981 [Phytophthora sojae]|eukprot:XP_009516739.1 hypothetical protein PHYSODRAFT_322981 [Phytophthora sojae]